MGVLVHWSISFGSVKPSPAFGNAYFTLYQPSPESLPPPSPALALLLLGVDSFPVPYRSLVVHFLLAAQLTIVRHWKDSSPPSYAETLSVLQLHYQLERLYALKHELLAQFENKWKYWRP